MSLSISAGAFTGTLSYTFSSTTNYDYDVYVVLKAGFAYSAVMLVNVSFTMPVFENSTPSLLAATSTGFSITIDSNVAATVHSVSVPNGATAPTIVNIENGQDADGTAALSATHNIGSGDAPTFLGTLNYAFTSTTNYDYDVYVVLKAGSVYSAVMSVDVAFRMPVFENSTPSLDSASATGFDIAIDSDIAVTVYSVRLPDGATAPTNVQIENGNNASDTAAPASMSLSISSGAFTDTLSYAFTSNTNYDYDVYVVLKAGGVYSAVELVNVSFRVPVFENSTPSLSSATNTGYVISIDSDIAVTVYTVRLADGAAAPTNVQIENGQDAGGTSVGPTARSSFSISNGPSFSRMRTTSFSSTPSYDYDVYVVLKAGFAYSAVMLVNVTYRTPVFEGMTPSLSSASSTGFDIAIDSDIAATAYSVRLADGAAAPMAAQIESGNDASDTAAPASMSISINTGTYTGTLSYNFGSHSSDYYNYDVYVVLKAGSAYSAVMLVNAFLRPVVDSKKLALGSQHSCLLKDGTSTSAVYCWGDGSYGRLGNDSTADIGSGGAGTVNVDASLSSVALSLDNSQEERIRYITAGSDHTCALSSLGRVYCWGQGANGRLGTGNANDVGDAAARSVSTLTAVNFGLDSLGNPITARQVEAGDGFTCAVLGNDARIVRCWGYGANGRLGNDSTTDVMNGMGANVTLGLATSESVSQLDLGWEHACVRLNTDAVRCWGAGASGQLGYNNTNDVGDGTGDSVSAAGDLDFGTDMGGTSITATAISLGNSFSCAILSTGGARCWGLAENGRLGNGQTSTSYNIGDAATRALADASDIVTPVAVSAISHIAAGREHACLVSSTNATHCWGEYDNGRMGYPSPIIVNDLTLPIIASVDTGQTGNISEIALGHLHSCLLYASGNLVCWGGNGEGQLGHNTTNDIGDDENPSAAASNPLTLPSLP